MAQATHLTAPDPHETGWPKGVPYIIGNEGCERFSFYGMKSILQVHLTGLFLLSGLSKLTSAEHAQEMYHLFVAATYAFPMIGAIIADRLLGKYRTILFLSLVYCLGHVVLSVAENSIGGMIVGLGLVAIGAGGIKPCVSAHVGDQFGKGNWRLVEKVFQAFYFIINFGSFFSTLLIPWIKNWESADPFVLSIGEFKLQMSLAFGLPGILMFIATVVFWMGRNVFVHVEPKPGGQLGRLDALSSSLLFMGLIGMPMFFHDVLGGVAFWVLTIWSVVMGLWLFEERQAIERDDGFLAVLIHSTGAFFTGGNSRLAAVAASEGLSREDVRRSCFFASAAHKFGAEVAEGPRAVLRIISVFLMVSVFWALFDQHGSSWVRQADMMQLKVDLFGWSGTLLSSQISSLNPLMVMGLIPLSNFLFYPLIDRYLFKMTPLRRMTVGMFLASVAFMSVAGLQIWIDAAAVSTTAGKISVLWQTVPYLLMTQAEVMVSITGLEFAYTQAPKRMKSTIMGFWLLSVALGNKLVAIVTLMPDMPLLKFFWVFTALMAVAAVLFGILASFYRGRDYSQ